MDKTEQRNQEALAQARGNSPLAGGDCMLIIDDDEINRTILHSIFSSDYAIEEAENGREGLMRVLRDPDRYCAVLLDMVMPEMDGLTVMQHLKRAGLVERVPLFLITAEASDATTREAYALGVMDVISKPVVPYVVRRCVGSVVELYRTRRHLSGIVALQKEELQAQTRKIFALNRGMIEALSAAIEFRDGESGDHVHRIHDITKFLLTHTPMGEGLSDAVIDQIAVASIMHDVGKIAIPDAILCKPGRLTREEFAIMKTHTTQGANMLTRIPQLRESAFYRYAHDIARHHHERWDGRGYPDGLKGDEISVWAQVTALADVYDALSSKRVYKEAYPRSRVLSMIRGGECGVFNPKLLECFFAVEDQLRSLLYPDDHREGQ